MLALTSGCRHVQTEHPWLSTCTARHVVLDTTEWQSVRAGHLGRVDAAYLAEAVKCLENQEAVAVTREYAAKACPSAEFRDTDGRSPFLVRGLTYDVPPSYSIVKFDERLNALFVYQASYDGELYIPGVYRLKPAPIIVFLRAKPSRVFAGAVWGGDDIFRGVRLDEQWFEHLGPRQ